MPFLMSRDTSWFTPRCAATKEQFYATTSQTNLTISELTRRNLRDEANLERVVHLTGEGELALADVLLLGHDVALAVPHLKANPDHDY